MILYIPDLLPPNKIIVINAIITFRSFNLRSLYIIVACQDYKFFLYIVSIQLELVPSTSSHLEQYCESLKLKPFALVKNITLLLSSLVYVVIHNALVFDQDPIRCKRKKTGLTESTVRP